MPIYEFYCPDNRRIYSFFARSLRYSALVPRCPDNPKWRMEKMISKFAVTGRAKEPSEMPKGGGPDDARMEAAMAEMEREFGGMDSENPDPRQLARMMRKMTDLTGDKTPPQMEEMLRRMEAGEDPEKLESEFGDVMDEVEGAEAAGELPGGASAVKRFRKRVTRDPVLYEMNEFVE